MHRSTRIRGRPTRAPVTWLDPDRSVHGFNAWCAIRSRPPVRAHDHPATRFGLRHRQHLSDVETDVVLSNFGVLESPFRRFGRSNEWHLEKLNPRRALCLNAALGYGIEGRPALIASAENIKKTRTFLLSTRVDTDKVTMFASSTLEIRNTR